MFAFTFSTTKLRFVEELNKKTIENGVIREEVIGTTYTDEGPEGKRNINILRQTEEVEVVAGVNSNFFNLNKWEVETENVSVLYGNRAINAVSEVSSFSVEFNLDGSLVNTHRYVNYNNNLSLKTYNNKNSLKYITKIKDVNSIDLNDCETTFLEGSDHVYNELATYYQIT